MTFWSLTAKCATEVSTRGCHRLSPESCPEPRFFPPSQSARQAVWSIFPSSLLGRRRSKLFWRLFKKCTTRPEKANQRIKQLQRKSPGKLERCNTPKRRMDQHSHPATSLESAPFRSLMLQTSVTRRCHLSGSGPLFTSDLNYGYQIKVQTEVKEAGHRG